MAVIVAVQSNHLYEGTDGGDLMTVSPWVHDDTLSGGGGSDTINAVGGEDIVLLGGDGSDLLTGGDGDTLDGGSGTDTAVLDLSGLDTAITADLSALGTSKAAAIAHASLSGVDIAVILLGAGDDQVASSSKAQVAIDGGEGSDALTGKTGVDLLAGGEGSDLVKGGGGSDVLFGFRPDQAFGVDLPSGQDDGSGHDTLLGGDGADILTGSLGDDRLDGGDGIDTASYDNAPDGVSLDLHRARQADGAAGSDVLKGIENLIGSGGDDHLIGSDGANALSGGSGADTLEGSGGLDVLSGGDGADVFVFARAADSDVLGPDLILDLQSGDTIDLSRIDADTGHGGNQAFHVVDHLSGKAGELVLYYQADAHQTVAMGDTDGDGLPDLVIDLAGDQTGFDGWTV